jgi:hypothetical protein
LGWQHGKLKWILEIEDILSLNRWKNSVGHKIIFTIIAHNLPIFLIDKNLAEHWDLPNTGIFFVASGMTTREYYTVASTLVFLKT